MDHFTQCVQDIKKLGDRLVPYNFPLAPQEWERDIRALKTADLIVDGYDITFHYSKSRYDQYYLESFQIFGQHAPFLPFHFVVKLAVKVLGDEHLSLVEFYQDNKKIYCWSICRDNEGRITDKPMLGKSELCQFEGLNYHYLNPEYLNFY